jgi:glycosyltransferase involved in cell wall biosynthesis
MNLEQPRVLFVFTEDWAFLSLFLDRAVAAKDSGYEVGVVVHCTQYQQTIKDHGLQVFQHNISRSGTNPFREISSVLQMVRIFRSFKPTILHLAALKPILIGSLASLFFPKSKIVNAPVGMGYIFSSSDRKARLLRPILRLVLRFVLGRKRTLTIIENSDDLQTLVDGKFVKKEQIILIRGTGVKLEDFVPTPEPSGPKVVVLVARMLRDKGVLEFVESARIVKRSHPDVIFWLVGDTDSGNPTALTSYQIETWVAEGLVSWLGYREDVPQLLQQSHIVCLPSYREGFGKVLIEAGAAQRAVVTTNVPGCRESIENGRNGLLVEPRDSVALAKALITLLDNDDMRIAMAAEGRHRVETEFSSEIINTQTLAVYKQVLSR